MEVMAYSQQAIQMNAASVKASSLFDNTYSATGCLSNIVISDPRLNSNTGMISPTNCFETSGNDNNPSFKIYLKA